MFLLVLIGALRIDNLLFLGHRNAAFVMIRKTSTITTTRFAVYSIKPSVPTIAAAAAIACTATAVVAFSAATVATVATAATVATVPFYYCVFIS